LENIVAMLCGQQVFGSLYSLAAEETYSGRLLPALACAGFLLSPVIQNRHSLFALGSTNWQDELADLEVTSARISDGAGGVASQYKLLPVRVRLYRLDFERQNLDQ
jgi:hypothetical protein